MESSESKDKGKKNIPEVQTYTVPFALGENKENIYINTNTPAQASKEQIINQAIKFHLKGNISAAKKYYQYFINQGFSDHRVFSNYGIILENLGKLKDAELYYRKAIELKPDFAEAHFNLGIILKGFGKLQDAEISYRKAIQLNSQYADAHLNLGTTLKDLGKLHDAELSTRKAIELKPDFADSYYNLGNILIDLDNIKDAEFYTRKAIELKPDLVDSYLSLGTILLALGKFKEAKSSFLKAIELKSDYADAYFNLSLLELLKGNYQSGLENYEFRFKKKQATNVHGKTTLKRINYQKLHKGEKLLVISEQAPGDIFIVMRYLLPLKQQGIDVSFCAPKKLHSLIKDSGIHDNPLSPEECSLVSEGEWIPLLSLLQYFNVSPQNPLINTPYISSTKTLKDKWRKILSKEKQPIVGINWQGNEKTERFYPGRSIPLEKFSKLLEINDIRFLSFQKGFGSEQMQESSFKEHFVSCQDHIDGIWDFSETAAIIENCDLIITNDCSMAPLAGGMGKKVWLLLRDVPFWYWGLESQSTFWYPSMRLFRQKERGNWQEVMERVSHELKNEIKA